MTIIEKYLEYKKKEALKIFCPASFPFLTVGMQKTLNPETCNGDYCMLCWNTEWKENV